MKGVSESLYPVILKIDELLLRGRVVVAIEGGSGSGKSTAAQALASLYGGSVIHMDHFFLRPEQRTAGRLLEAGGNLDRERFSSEVIPSLRLDCGFSYRPFDCSRGELGCGIWVEPSRLIIVEGSYSTHPAFGTYYDLAVFLEVSEGTRRERILKRNPENYRDFFDKWIPMENKFFDSMNIKGRCDLIVNFEKV